MRRRCTLYGTTSQRAPRVAPGVPDPRYFAALKTQSAEEAGDIEINPIPATSQQLSTAQYVDPAPNNFVRRSVDGSLVLMGRRYFGFGTNNYGLAAQPEIYGNATFIRQLMQAYKAEGINVLRIWYVLWTRLYS